MTLAPDERHFVSAQHLQCGERRSVHRGHRTLVHQTCRRFHPPIKFSTIFSSTRFSMCMDLLTKKLITHFLFVGLCALVVASCSNEEVYFNTATYHDTVRGVTCWVFLERPNTVKAASCVPDSLLKK